MCSLISQLLNQINSIGACVSEAPGVVFPTAIVDLMATALSGLRILAASGANSTAHSDLLRRPRGVPDRPAEDPDPPTAPGSRGRAPDYIPTGELSTPGHCPASRPEPDASASPAPCGTSAISASGCLAASWLKSIPRSASRCSEAFTRPPQRAGDDYRATLQQAEAPGFHLPLRCLEGARPEAFERAMVPVPLPSAGSRSQKRCRLCQTTAHMLNRLAGRQPSELSPRDA